MKQFGKLFQFIHEIREIVGVSELSQLLKRIGLEQLAYVYLLFHQVQFNPPLVA